MGRLGLWALYLVGGIAASLYYGLLTLAMVAFPYWRVVTAFAIAALVLLLLLLMRRL